MLILTIRTDKPEAELGLYEDDQQLAYITWPAHRELAETVHIRIKELLESQHKQLAELEGVATYKGPGSFTGLRIGLTVANALASSLSVPVVAETGADWQTAATKRLQVGENETQVIPYYGAPVHITQQKR